MKILATTLFAGFASAEWGVWVKNMGCNTPDAILAEKRDITSASAGDLQMVCQDWCAANTNAAAGDALCCDFVFFTEAQDGQCFLFSGHGQGYESLNDGEVVEMMEFT